MLYQPLVAKLQTVETLTEAEKQAAIALCGDIRAIPRRQDIISEGATPEKVHIVLQGWAARYHVLRDGGRRITAFMLPGDFCDIHVTTLATMDHGILAITECRVAYVSHEQIDRITRSTPALTRAFWRATLIDEAILRQWLVSSGRRDAYEAVGHLLCELHARMQQIGLVRGDTLGMPLTQEEIGDALGLTPIHVNRVLRRLRQEGMVETPKGALQLLDIPGLRQASGFDPNYLHLRDRR